MGKVYAMGDTHGNWYIIKELCKNMTEDDIVIHVGDHGVNYFGDDDYNRGDRLLKETMAKTKPTFILIDGNHDRSYPSWYSKVLKTDVIKGEFYIDEEYPTILHCPKINTFLIENVKFLTLAGAYSIDKKYRLEMGYNWFEDEQISEEQMTKFKNQYTNYKTDIIISHTAPKKYEPTHLFLSYINQSEVDKRTEEFLDWVDEHIDYSKWFLGHYHANEQLWDKGYMLFESVKEIMTF